MGRGSEDGGRGQRAGESAASLPCTLQTWIAGSCDDASHAAMTAKVLADDALRAEARVLLRGPLVAVSPTIVRYRPWRWRWPADRPQPLWSCRAPHLGRGQSLCVEREADGTLCLRDASGTQLERFVGDIVALVDPVLDPLGLLVLRLQPLAEQAVDVFDAVAEAADQVAMTEPAALDADCEAVAGLLHELIAALEPSGHRDLLREGGLALDSDTELAGEQAELLVAMHRARVALEGAAEALLDESVDDALLDLDARLEAAGVETALAALPADAIAPSLETLTNEAWWSRVGSAWSLQDRLTTAIRGALLGIDASGRDLVEIPAAESAKQTPQADDPAPSIAPRTRGPAAPGVRPKWPFATGGGLGSSGVAHATLEWLRPSRDAHAEMQGYSRTLATTAQLIVVVAQLAVKEVALCGQWRATVVDDSGRYCATFAAAELQVGGARFAGFDFLQVRRIDGAVEVWPLAD